jgi:hypothetical protein
MCVVRMDYRMGYKERVGVAEKFLDAVRENPIRAWGYVAAAYSGVDFKDLQKLLSKARLVKGCGVSLSPRGCTTRSYALDCGHLLHLRMVRDPRGWRVSGSFLEVCA